MPGYAFEKLEKNWRSMQKRRRVKDDEEAAPRGQVKATDKAARYGGDIFFYFFSFLQKNLYTKYKKTHAWTKGSVVTSRKIARRLCVYVCVWVCFLKLYLQCARGFSGRNHVSSSSPLFLLAQMLLG